MHTHEKFIQRVAAIVAMRLSAEQRAKLDGVKLVYGAGSSGVRGITYYNQWHSKGCDHAVPFVEVCAFGQSNWIQVAGTTIHELAHVVAGFEAGHGKGWKELAEQMGLRRPKAAGMVYHLASLDPAIRAKIAALPRPDEGEPVSAMSLGLPYVPRPCTAGVGSRGGKSRGTGSGSRLRKYTCACTPRVILRHAGDELACHCDHCGEAFKQG